ncbi:YhdH/YhfP family quinone oxidoreductase [Balneola sp. MJW-20]|uniref:YhdH/YhfP family quinone oxidoreductase n=1 Tax=Gracilimonas aurantiaca TaxID=3234185 RepID=UPI00390B0E95
MNTFKALWVEETESGSFKREIKDVPLDKLPDHDVLIEVHYSSLNYKDGLSATGNKGVTRKYPHIPGIDASGIVLDDRSGTYSKGDKVLVTGRDLGSNTFGGFGGRISVPVDWVVPMPDGLDLKKSMIYGTAGFTAMYGVLRLKRELITPDKGKVLVTGATGGVGSLAVNFLSAHGYHVIAATGKMEKKSFLINLGAAEVIHRDAVTKVTDKLMLERKWAGCIETVGGEMLDAVIRQTAPDGGVACCGNILGHQVHTNIYPFILRGVSLLGIDSAICKMPMRLKIWEEISELSEKTLPDQYVKEVKLSELEPEIHKIMQGKQTGRVILKHE